MPNFTFGKGKESIMRRVLLWLFRVTFVYADDVRLKQDPVFFRVRDDSLTSRFETSTYGLAMLELLMQWYKKYLADKKEYPVSNLMKSDAKGHFEGLSIVSFIHELYVYTEGEKLNVDLRDLQKLYLDHFSKKAPSIEKITLELEQSGDATLSKTRRIHGVAHLKQGWKLRQEDLASSSVTNDEKAASDRKVFEDMIAAGDYTEN